MRRHRHGHPDVSFITICGAGLLGLLEELGCWSVDDAGLAELPLSPGLRISVSGVLPVVPIVDVEGRESVSARKRPWSTCVLLC